MHLKNQPPIFVPSQHCPEIEALSKAALMDVAWDLATRCAGSEDTAAIMAELRSTMQIITDHRRDAVRDARRQAR